MNTGALMRARIKVMLDEHQKLAWWKDHTCTKSPQESNDCGLEHFLALVLVMHDVPAWSLLGSPPGLVDDTNEFNPHQFDEEDCILYIGQMVADIWERVDRSLARGSYFKLGMEGLERAMAINKVVGTVVGNSRVVISGLAQAM